MRTRKERGSASVLALAAAGVVLVLVVAILEAAAAYRARHTAASAADLAALAASRAVESGQDGCAAAEDVARRNGADVVDCRLDAAVATVRTEVHSDRWWGGGWSVEQKARAAPTSYLEEGS
ncbi:MAG: flp pilus-assembly TadE/G-like family protein [Aeromicrobium sp.]|uniref:Rv3654c family TadE-like protein n=1 Tax=Aeromicrobium sp. TaxID=1871063 RepID=UPI0039E4867C